jgi:hypothetical protein
MTDSEQNFTIPVVFEVAATTREQAAQVLHTRLSRADRLLTDAAPLRELGDVFYPLEDRWFPEAELKHIDGNSHADLRLREPHPFSDTYAQTPVFDMLAEIFPEQPDPDAFRDEHGVVDENAYGAAFDEFTEQALDVAMYLRRPTHLLERVEEIQRLREGIAALLEEHPLPAEPRRQDYLVTIAPGSEAEIEGARYAWDHTQWQADFNQIAGAREQRLSRLLDTDSVDATSSPREHSEVPSRHGEGAEPATNETVRSARSTTWAVDASPAPARPSAAEELWTYRVPVEFEVSARTADEARTLVDDGLTGDAPAGTPAAVQQRQHVLADGDVHGVLGWRHLGNRDTPPAPTSRLERGVLLSDLLRDRGHRLTGSPGTGDPEADRRGLRPDLPGL